MRTFKTRRRELSAALAIVSAACGVQVGVHPSVLPGGPLQSASAACPGGRFAIVTNPTTGAVTVAVDTRTLAGRNKTTILGTVDAASSGEFRLSADDGTTLQFEWAVSAAGGSQELGRVRYKIRCENDPRDY